MSKVLFLPSDYQAPKSSGFYMKFQEGENKFRILSQPVLGWEDWQDKKPIRYRMENKPARSVDPKKPLKHFWSMIVWNYVAEEIQILHLTQATIRRSLEALCADEDWGAPYFYDLKVVKSGEGMETEYMLNPLPHKPLAPHIRDLFDERKCNLEALFDNEDPFAPEHSHYTAGVFSKDDVKVEAKTLTMDQAYDLEMIIGECDKKYQIWFFDYIGRTYKTGNIAELPAAIYSKMLESATTAMEKNRSKQQQQSTEIPVDFILEEAQ
jgi:hypothetical protein